MRPSTVSSQTLEIFISGALMSGFGISLLGRLVRGGEKDISLVTMPRAKAAKFTGPTHIQLELNGTSSSRTDW